MKVMRTHISDVLIIQPHVYQDTRGFFIETYQQQRYEQAGLDLGFVQDNHSRSSRKTLRGLHYQTEHPQGKLCRVVRGEVYDVAVDLRRDSPTFGQWVGVYLSDRNHLQVYAPPGCAHGFCVVSREAEFLYKCTDYYHPEFERTLLWNDPSLAIRWPIRDPLLSEKDSQGSLLRDAPCYELTSHRARRAASENTLPLAGGSGSEARGGTIPANQ